MRPALIVLIVVVFAAAVLADEKKNGPGTIIERTGDKDGGVREGLDDKGVKNAGNNKECDTPIGKLTPGEERRQGCQKIYCCKNGQYKIFPCGQPQPNCQANPDECCK